MCSNPNSIKGEQHERLFNRFVLTHRGRGGNFRGAWPGVDWTLANTKCHVTSAGWWMDAYPSGRTEVRVRLYADDRRHRHLYGDGLGRRGMDHSHGGITRPDERAR